MMEAASGGLMEVELGKLAATNTSSAEVKQFGKKMVEDHNKANTELKALAATKNVTLPAAPNERHQDHINDLKEKKGSEFDKAYIGIMVDDHNQDINKFEKETNEGSDAEVKNFASVKLPTLKKHHEMAKTINDKKIMYL